MQVNSPNATNFKDFSRRVFLPTNDVLRDGLWRCWFLGVRLSICLPSWNLKPELEHISSMAWTLRSGLPLEKQVDKGEAVLPGQISSWVVGSSGAANVSEFTSTGRRRERTQQLAITWPVLSPDGALAVAPLLLGPSTTDTAPVPTLQRMEVKQRVAGLSKARHMVTVEAHVGLRKEYISCDLMAATVWGGPHVLRLFYGGVVCRVQQAMVRGLSAGAEGARVSVSYRN